MSTLKKHFEEMSERIAGAAFVFLILSWLVPQAIDLVSRMLK